MPIKTSTKLFIALSILLVWQITTPIRAQSAPNESQQLPGSQQIAAAEVVETTVEDLGFLLSLHDSVSGNTSLLQQVKEDYFPLFDQQVITQQVLKSGFQKIGKARREYLGCLAGLTFFNAHLDIVAQEPGKRKIFSIVRPDPMVANSVVTNSDVTSVDVTMSREGEKFKITYLLVYRRQNSIWKIADFDGGAGSMLTNIRTGLQEIYDESIIYDADAYTQATTFLIRHNSGKMIKASQWCEPTADEQAGPVTDSKPDQTDKADGNEIYKVKAVLSGEPHSVHVEVAPDGTVLFQEDMILGTDGDLNSVSGLDFSKLRLWSDAVVPYLIDETISDRAVVLRAIEDWVGKTPVRFVEAGADDENILVFTEGDGCRSSIGMNGGTQYIFLDRDCSYGAVLHEIGHTLGLIHEHSRDDRDNFIAVIQRNILSDKEINFYKHPPGHPVSDAYCYGSIMHYPENAFSISRELKTIEVKGSYRIGLRKRLSSCDVDRIRALYAPLAKAAETGDDKK